MSTTVTLRAPAKVNLYLGVHATTDDEGYHLLDTVMHALDLHDTLVCQWTPAQHEADGFMVELTTKPSLAVPDEANLAYRAAIQLHQAVCPHRAGVCKITLSKAIPLQAGLGGGSSDAAAVLKALAQLWNLSLTDERLLKTARSLGADVAFFLDDHVRPAYLTHRGDVTRERFSPLSGSVLLVKPDAPISTAAAYQHFDQHPQAPHSSLAELLHVMRTSTPDQPYSAEQAAPLFANNLTATACALEPSIRALYEFFAGQRIQPLLCGSGSTLCVPLASEEQGRSLSALLSAYALNRDEKLWVLPTCFC